MSALAARPRQSLDRWREILGRFLKTPKGYLFLLFLPLVLVTCWILGMDRVLPQLGSAIVGASAVEIVMVRRRRRRWIWPSSAILSGAIIAFVLGLETSPILTALIGALATGSKYALTANRRHIFNPAALALLVASVVFRTDQSWWGALPDAPWPLLIALVAGGLVVSDRTYKLPVVLVFTGAYYTLLTLIGLSNPTPVVELFREPFVHSALFFACFMLTDPPTSPGRNGDQIWYGILVAQACVIAQLAGAGQTFLLIGLLLGNATLAAQQWSERGTAPLSPRPFLPRGEKGEERTREEHRDMIGNVEDR